MKFPFRLILVLFALPVIVFVLLQQCQRLLQDRSILPIDDFVEYWAAGQLNAHGQNPYDPDKLLPLEQAAGRDTDEAIMMWNPPWTLTLAMPFGSLPSRPSQLLWIGLGLAFIVWGADMLWCIYDGPASARWASWLLALTYMPTLFVLNAGQIGTWIFAGAVLFLYFQKRGWSMLAGTCTVFLAIKPHLAYLFWIALIVWGIRRDWRLLLGGLLAGAIATIIPLLYNPLAITQYWESLTLHPPAQWQSPTIGSVIRMVEGESRFGLTFLPNLFGLAWLSWYALASPARWEWRRQMPLLLLVSFVTASYGAWPFDLIILLPAVIQVAAAIARRPTRKLVGAGIGFWFAINLSALVLNVMKIGSFWFIWMAPALLIAYVYFLKQVEQE